MLAATVIGGIAAVLAFVAYQQKYGVAVVTREVADTGTVHVLLRAVALLALLALLAVIAAASSNISSTNKYL